jgi:hypothetical protein
VADVVPDLGLGNAVYFSCAPETARTTSRCALWVAWVYPGLFTKYCFVLFLQVIALQLPLLQQLLVNPTLNPVLNKMLFRTLNPVLNRISTADLSS